MMEIAVATVSLANLRGQGSATFSALASEAT